MADTRKCPWCDGDMIYNETTGLWTCSECGIVEHNHIEYQNKDNS